MGAEKNIERKGPSFVGVEAVRVAFLPIFNLIVRPLHQVLHLGEGLHFQARGQLIRNTRGSD